MQDNRFTPQNLMSLPGGNHSVVLRDGTIWEGALRTGLLSEKSLSVYIDAGDDGPRYISTK